MSASNDIKKNIEEIIDITDLSAEEIKEIEAKIKS